MKPIIVNRKPCKCPKCGGKVVPIVYGMPAPELYEKAQRKEVVLGGCCITEEGDPTKITGSNLFMRLNYWVVFCGGDILTLPPTLSGVDAPAAATLALSDEAFTLTLASIPSVITNIKLVICASEPQSNGISKAYAKAAEFIAPQTPVTTAIALKTAYDNKYGAPSEGKPKVFVKYFYVNTATGEKSGDMLALAVLEDE